MIHETPILPVSSSPSILGGGWRWSTPAFFNRVDIGVVIDVVFVAVVDVAVYVVATVRGCGL